MRGIKLQPTLYTLLYLVCQYKNNELSYYYEINKLPIFDILFNKNIRLF